MGGPDEIRRFAREGFDSIPPEWIGTYFRWWGVYTQGDGAGVVGGKDGEGKALPFFMLRIRIPNGILRSDQLRTIADITAATPAAPPTLPSAKTSNCTGSPSKLCPRSSKHLWRVGLNTIGACGDVTRNVTGCPVAGVDADEICDALRSRPRSRPYAGRQRRVLQPAAQIQNLDHRMPRLVPLSRDQRCRPHRGRAAQSRKI